MRILVVAVSLLLSVSMAAAQDPDAGKSMLQILEEIGASCKRDVESQGEYQVSVGTIRRRGCILTLGDNRPDRRICAKLDALDQKLLRHRVNCDQLEEWRKRAQQRRPVPPNVSVLIRNTRGLSDQIKRDLVEIRRQLAARGVPVPEISQWPWRGARFEVFVDLGGNFGLNQPMLDNFGQTLARGRSWTGAVGGTFIWPVAGPGFGDRRKAMLEDIVILTGAKVIRSESTPERVDNIVPPFGSLNVTGRYDTTAVLGTVGLGVQPFERLRFTFDVGLGTAFHHVRVFGPAGNIVISSNDNSLAWMLRGALLYPVTDNVSIGVFASHLRTEGITAQTGNGQPFAMGGRSDNAVGVTFGYILPLERTPGSLFPERPIKLSPRFEF